MNVSEINSKCLNVECEVPQGSIVGPTLFILYMNHIICSNIMQMQMILIVFMQVAISMNYLKH